MDDDGNIWQDSVHLHPSAFSRDACDDKQIMKSLWKVLDGADVVIGHNLDKFDLPKIYTRMIKHRMKPPSPCKQIDTYKIAKQKFAFTSNRLDFLAQFLGLGKKKESGWKLWQGCIDRDLSSYEKMLAYNQHDVVLLKRVFDYLAPWVPSLQNSNVLSGDKRACPACGSKRLRSKGLAHTKVNTYRRLVCNDCGAHSRESNVKGTAGVVGI